jgi:predicted negative regulator of RcsB-dependent stress response
VASRKKKKNLESAAETLDQLESTGDRIVAWVGENPVMVLGTACAILALAGAYGLVSHRVEAARERSSSELAHIQTEFRNAMGANPDTIDIPEPANPETARQVRTRFAEQFATLARDYEGTTSGALAALEAARLQAQLGERPAALETLSDALAELPSDSAVRPFLLSESASLQEAAGDWSEAAAAYRAAFAQPSNPLRWQALADAARCLLEAGEASQALELYGRIQREAVDYRMPAYLEARLRELEQVAPRG